MPEIAATLRRRLETLANHGGHAAVPAAAEAVNELILSGEELAGSTLVDALAGQYGDAVARGAWGVLERGVAIGNAGTLDTAQPLLASFASVCLFKGRLDTLRAVVHAGPPAVVPPILVPSNAAEYLGLLCTTESERSHPSFERVPSLVEVVVANAGDTPHCLAALELAWDIDPDHADWDVCDDGSLGAALVREFHMRRTLSATCSDSLSIPSAAPHRRRTAV